MCEVVLCCVVWCFGACCCILFCVVFGICCKISEECDECVLNPFPSRLIHFYHSNTSQTTLRTETSGAVSERALQLLSDAAEEFETAAQQSGNVDHAVFEGLSAKCFGILCKEGNVHIGAVPQVTR